MHELSRNAKSLVYNYSLSIEVHLTHNTPTSAYFILDFASLVGLAKLEATSSAISEFTFQFVNNEL